MMIIFPVVSVVFILLHKNNMIMTKKQAGQLKKTQMRIIFRSKYFTLEEKSVETICKKYIEDSGEDHGAVSAFSGVSDLGGMVFRCDLLRASSGRDPLCLRRCPGDPDPFRTVDAPPVVFYCRSVSCDARHFRIVVSDPAIQRQKLGARIRPSAGDPVARRRKKFYSQKHPGFPLPHHARF